VISAATAEGAVGRVSCAIRRVQLASQRQIPGCVQIVEGPSVPDTVGASKRVRSSSIVFATNSPKSVELVGVTLSVRTDVLGFRSVMTMPHLSRTSFNFLRSKSRSVVPETVPVGTIASLIPS
jgi:hypothetical protein